MGVAVKRTMYQRKIDVDMLNAVKSVLAHSDTVEKECVGKTRAQIDSHLTTGPVSLELLEYFLFPVGLD